MAPQAKILAIFAVDLLIFAVRRLSRANPPLYTLPPLYTTPPFIHEKFTPPLKKFPERVSPPFIRGGGGKRYVG